MGNNDGMFVMASLLGAIWGGPSNLGKRSDGKICTAQGGECRANHRFYSLGMRDAKSWAQPCADDTCPARCGYLRGEARDIPQEQRQEFVQDMINGLRPKSYKEESIFALRRLRKIEENSTEDGDNDA